MSAFKPIKNRNGLCLDVRGESKDNGASILLYRCNGGSNQNFSFTDQGKIKNENSGKCIRIKPGSYNELDQYDCDYSPSWTYYDNGQIKSGDNCISNNFLTSVKLATYEKCYKFNSDTKGFSAEPLAIQTEKNTGTIYTNRDYYSTNPPDYITIKPNMTRNTCVNECVSSIDRECGGAVYDKNTKTCYIRGKYFSGNQFFNDNSKETFVSKNDVPVTNKYTVQNNSDYYNTDNNSVISAEYGKNKNEAFNKCEDKCAKDTNCSAFIVHRNKETNPTDKNSFGCFLRNANMGKNRNTRLDVNNPNYESTTYIKK